MDKEFPWWKAVMTVLTIGAIVVALFSGLFIGEQIAIRALENQGFANVRIVDKQWFLVGMRGCGRDAAKFTARAVNPAQREVDIFVCVGWPFKGATVRSN
ncbi:MAG: hypothetical protein Q8R30_01030 [bacterium]|nr:hypothetical protein [bacterium]MDZ4285679.1 hypothetical protein [Candidatus Sungbacteria bacterium]